MGSDFAPASVVSFVFDAEQLARVYTNIIRQVVPVHVNVCHTTVRYTRSVPSVGEAI